MSDLFPHFDAEIDRLAKSDVHVEIADPDHTDVMFRKSAYECLKCDVDPGVTTGHTNEF